jgi:hypothetical protein
LYPYISSLFLVTPIHPHMRKSKAMRFPRDDYTARIFLSFAGFLSMKKFHPQSKRFGQRLKKGITNEYPDFDLRIRGHEDRAAPIDRQGIDGERGFLNAGRTLVGEYFSRAQTSQRTGSLNTHNLGISFNINRPSVRCGPSAKLGRHLRSRFRCSMCSAVRMD